VVKAVEVIKVGRVLIVFPLLFKEGSGVVIPHYL
jgi:hypothetical protein